MTFTFKRAVREQVSVLIGLAGPSGSGKTYTALRLACGLAPNGKIAFIEIGDSAERKVGFTTL